MSNPFTFAINGLGKVATSATVAEKAFIGEDCQVLGACEVYGESIIHENSQLSGAVKVFGGADVKNSRLHGSVIVSGDGVRISDSLLIGDIVVSDNAILDKCDLRCAPGQQIRITENAKLVGVTIYGPLTVKGDAIVRNENDARNLELYPSTDIVEGDWTRAPRVVRSVFQFNLTESIDDRLVIGCQCHSIETWKKLDPNKWQALGFSPEEIAEYFNLINAW